MIHDVILVAIAAVVAQVPAVAKWIKSKITKVEAVAAPIVAKVEAKV